MTNRKKLDPSWLGVPLDEVLAILAPTTLVPRIVGNTLIATHEHYSTRVVVAPPARRESANGPIRAVVRVLSGLPAPLQPVLGGAEAGATLNSMAALGALTMYAGERVIASRLTIYEAERAWEMLQLPLVAFAALMGSEAILGGLRRTFGVAGTARAARSEWTASDFKQVERFLDARGWACTTGGLGLSAEFGLGGGAGTAMLGDTTTALLELSGEEPHPELGGGLLGTLQMPYRVRDPSRLRELCDALNRMELETDDLPPHFGAWCAGRLGDNLAYVTFLPNALHEVRGVALNVSLWAMVRSRWANDALRSLGVR
jgi:hypothetical protein